MAAARSSTALVPVQPVFTDAERLALAGYLAGYRGLTREAYTLDLRQFTGWCRARSLALFAVRRADIETFARELEAKGRARATVTRRLSTIAGFYRYAVEEELLDHSPAAHVRRPRVDYESHATALDRNEVGALLVAAGLGPAAEHLGLERGHRTLVVTRKGGKVVTVPLAPRTARDRPGDRRAHRRSAVPGRRRPAPRPARRGPDSAPGHPPRRDHQEGRPAHPAARVHYRRPRRRSSPSRRAGSCVAR